MNTYCAQSLRVPFASGMIGLVPEGHGCPAALSGSEVDGVWLNEAVGVAVMPYPE